MAVVNNPKLYTNTRDLSSQKFVTNQNIPAKDVNIDEALKQYLSKLDAKSKLIVKQEKVIEIPQEKLPEFKEEVVIKEEKPVEIPFETTEEPFEDTVKEEVEDKSSNEHQVKSYYKNKKNKK